VKLLAALLLSAAPAFAQVPALRYAQTYSALNSIYSLPVNVAVREGLFKREGINFEVVIPIPGGTDRMIDALHDGIADLAHVATPFLVRKHLAGSDAVAVVAEFNSPIYSLVARPDVKGYAALKGKVVGMADPSGSITASMRKLLALHGIRDGDINVKTIDGTPARLTCLKKGDCAAVPLGQPQDLQAISEGYRLLGLSTEVVPKALYTVTAARRSWAAANRDAVVRYARGLASAFRVIRDPARRASVVKIIVETTSVAPAVAERTLDLYFKPEKHALPMQGEIDVDGLAKVIELMGEAGLLVRPLPPAERFVDLSYLRAAGVR
jgi:ABC-type nitrate/sulfonate/bicarbonate transport system substrate-binding protein